MDAKKITIDGVDVLSHGVYYTHKSWLELAVSDESRDISGMHARYVSPTYGRIRVITLEGIIYRDYADREAVERLRGMFRLQGSHTSEVDARSVVVTDEYGDEWRIMAKVKEPIDFEE